MGEKRWVGNAWDGFQEVAKDDELPLKLVSFENYYVTKDSGQQHEKFATGSQRDSRVGKGRYDLLPCDALKRDAELYERGAQKYDARNWELGQPASRYMDSLLRHALQYLSGARDEDHLAAIRFNAAGIIRLETEQRTELLDLPVNKPPTAAS